MLPSPVSPPRATVLYLPPCPTPMAPSPAVDPEIQSLRQRNQALEQRVQQLEQALAQRETVSQGVQLQEIAATMPGVLFQFSVRDGVWQIDYISDRIGDFMRAPAEQFKTLESIFQHIHPEDVEDYLASIEAAVSNRVPWHYEGRLIRPDGQVIWWQGNSTPIDKGPGEMVFCGFILEVTEQKEVAQNIEDAYNRTQAIIESISDPFFILDANWCFTYLNRQTEPVLERTIEDLLGKHIWQEFPLAIGSDFYRYYHQVMAERVTINFETYYPPLDRWFRVRAYPFEEGISVYFQDVSDLKRSQQALEVINAALEDRVQERTAALQRSVEQLQKEIRDRQLAEQKLQSQAQFLQSIWEGVDYGIFVADVLNQGDSFCYSAYNPAMARMSPIDFEPLLNRPIEDCFPPERIAPFKRNYQICVATKQTVTFEECYPTSSGELTWWLLRVTPIFDRMGEVEQLVITVNDITTRKETEACLQRSEAELRQKAENLETTLRELKRTQTQLVQSEKMSSLGQLVAGVAHEINNPVNFIYGNLNHAKQYAEDLLQLLDLYGQTYPDPTAEILDAIEAIDLEFIHEDLPKLIASMAVGADRIRQIVASLRNFSRLDEADIKEVDIREGIESTLMILQNRLKGTSDRPAVTLTKDYGQIPLLYCYPGQLNQVFMNLLSNALDAIEMKQRQQLNQGQKPEAGQITIRTLVEDAHLVVAIKDNGLGMDAATQERLFDPFFTTKPVGQGTGLGLSISYQIVVDRHQGTLQCESSPGAGATFLVRLPLARPAA